MFNALNCFGKLQHYNGMVVIVSCFKIFYCISQKMIYLAMSKLRVIPWWLFCKLYLDINWIEVIIVGLHHGI